jgi:hypothetical protein
VALDKLSSSSVDSLITQAVKESSAKATHDQLLKDKAKESERKRLLAALSELRDKDPDFTTKRQVLVLRLMLKHLGMKRVKKTVQANFIRFLIGKTQKDIYKAVGEPNFLAFKDGRDAAYVRKWFQDLGLTEIVEEIDKPLNSPHEKLPPERREKK